MAKQKGKLKKRSHRHKRAKAKTDKKTHKSNCHCPSCRAMKKTLADNKLNAMRSKYALGIPRFARSAKILKNNWLTGSGNRTKAGPKSKNKSLLHEDAKLTRHAGGETSSNRKAKGRPGCRGVPAHSVVANGYNFIHRAIPTISDDPVLNYRSYSYYRKPPEAPVQRWTIDKVFQVKSHAAPFMALAKEDPRFESIRYMWHGTKTEYVESIAASGLRTDKANGGYLGSGIYLTPDFAKAWGYTGWGRYIGSDGSYCKSVLLCAARTGKVWKDAANVSIRNRKECRKMGFDTAFAGSGANPTAYAGRLRYSEYCFYRDEQVLPLYVITFRLPPLEI